MGIAVGPPQFTPYEMPVQPLNVLQERLPIDEGQLWLLTPAGLGDNLWIAGKFWKLVEERRAQGRMVTFCLPSDEQRRSGDIFQMLGWNYSYQQGFSTEWVWGRPGSPAIPDSGAILSIQPNRHLEHGHRIEKWYPDMEYRNPVELLREPLEVTYKHSVGKPQYVVGFMSQAQYMEYGGNLKPGQWARIWQHVEEKYGPVILVGAGKDMEFMAEVLKIYEPSMPPATNTTGQALYRIMAGAKMVIGAHAGPLILSTLMGVPTLQAMPRWLWPMVGTWELNTGPWAACFLDNLENVVREDITWKGGECAQEMREEMDQPVRVHVSVDTLQAAEAEHKKNGHGRAKKAAQEKIAAAV